MPIYKPSELHQLGVRPRRRLSQNFLIDQNILEKICVVANICAGDTVLEIGPGPGALTEHLLSKGAYVIAVEKDPYLAKQLERMQNDLLTIYCDDALTFSLDKLPSKCKVVANLPYNITTPLIERLIAQHKKISSLTLMVQKEVGKRMTAHTNTPDYSSFSLFLQAYSFPRYCFSVKPTSFFPAPKVTSCVVHLPLHPFPFPFSEEDFFTFTRRAFRQRRKMLRVSLKEWGVDLSARPQELSLEEFATLFVNTQNSKTYGNS